MMTLGEFERMLATSLATVRPRLEIGLDKVGELAQTIAVHAIGNEQEGWPPLAESTIADKAAKGYAVPAPLLRTGEMRDSIKRELDPFDLEVVVGSASPIALYQEMGTSRIPPRPFLEMGMKNALPFAEETFGKIAVSLLTGAK
jgi:HK97 gp10 family phage protein